MGVGGDVRCSVGWWGDCDQHTQTTDRMVGQTKDTTQSTHLFCLSLVSLSIPSFVSVCACVCVCVCCVPTVTVLRFRFSFAAKLILRNTDQSQVTGSPVNSTSSSRDTEREQNTTHKEKEREEYVRVNTINERVGPYDVSVPVHFKGVSTHRILLCLLCHSDSLWCRCGGCVTACRWCWCCCWRYSSSPVHPPQLPNPPRRKFPV